MDSLHDFPALFPTNLNASRTAPSLKFTNKRHNIIIHISPKKCKKIMLTFIYLLATI